MQAKFSGISAPANNANQSNLKEKIKLKAIKSRV